ncbi:hypothetical protein ACMFMG_000686 [Clarireedia jacksonii]
MSLSSEETTRYATIIDKILKEGDLNTISAKQIRKDLQDELGFDLSDKKDAIKALIMERFDEASKDTPEASTSPSATNGHSKTEDKDEDSQNSSPKHEDGESDGYTSPPKKKAKREKHDDDAKLAAMLQAQENSRTRSTRGGGTKRGAAVKKSTPKKKKSSAKVKATDDSDVELNSDGEPKEVVRKGGFHKQYHLSAALADLVGEPTLSRPQVVKKIWEHIKANDLQDPDDKRQIICDAKMYSVFSTQKVHMFTMNKLLGKQLYPVEEE